MNLQDFEDRQLIAKAKAAIAAGHTVEASFLVRDKHSCIRLHNGDGTLITLSARGWGQAMYLRTALRADTSQPSTTNRKETRNQ